MMYGVYSLYTFGLAFILLVGLSSAFLQSSPPGHTWSVQNEILGDPSAGKSDTTRTNEIRPSLLHRNVYAAKSVTALPMFGKMFEESGPLGKGITIGKVQVALNARDRGAGSIFDLLESKAASSGDSPSQVQLARLTNEVCLALLRKSDEWVGACSESKWFSQKDAGKAEGLYNDWSNKEAAKFEKEYVPDKDSDVKPGGPTIVVVSLVLEIQGDTTKFDGAGFSISGTREVVSSVASDSMVDGGYCLNAAEVFWTPGERDEVLTSRDVILDFPEIVDM
uniref:Uncharacterized protein n=1 Tax=Attheya septentrionalis TaxID=420275 RepID=A0A7S2UEM4_9STRA|mmetsp:Transcript_22342/g.40320  ORF Transcript_22342/g.40320 Transcript_22342/m.40320 type:complete len:279 (+) Transcript_22342:39-875(+)